MLMRIANIIGPPSIFSLQRWARQPGELGVWSADLAKAMQTDEEHAQALLGRLSASGRVRVDVRDDAELSYTAENEAVADAESEADAREQRLRAR